MTRWFAGLILLIGGIVLADWCFPPDLTRYRDRSAALYAADGSLLHLSTTRDGKWRMPAGVGMVDPGYIAMLMAAEDHRFRDHVGVDGLAALRAIGQFIVSGRIVSGGSTLTMQVARLLEPHPRSVVGKLHDLVRALQLERRFDKDEILAMYLTLAPFGGNIEGVEAASRVWFGHEAGRLTPGEAAILVALPQRPAALRPDRHGQATLAAAERILARLVAAGRLDARTLETPPPPINRLYPFPRFAPHVAEYVRRRGGQGATTLDRSLQVAIEGVARDVAAMMGDGGDVAIVVMDNRDAAIRAWVGGVSSYLDLARRPRSPGSALKPFIYGLAFDDLALVPDSLIDDHPLRIGDYAPENFDHGFHGQVTARTALQQSLNVPAIALLDRVGPTRLAADLQAAGGRLRFPAGGTVAPTIPLALGGVGISLVDLTRLYGGLAHDGRSRPLSLLPGRTERGVPLMSDRSARLVTEILRGSLPPDGRVTPRLIADARPIAYKTGTSYGFRDAWALGYSPTWTVGIWTGRADGTPRPGAFGRNTAAPILFRIFDLLPAETEADPLAQSIAAEPAPVSVPKALAFFADRDSVKNLPHVEPPRILYPPDGAVLDLTDEDRGRGTLQLEADRGEPPYHWSVNGVPVPNPGHGSAPHWEPDGPGFAKITVIDRVGRRASVTVMLE